MYRSQWRVECWLLLLAVLAPGCAPKSEEAATPVSNVWEAPPPARLEPGIEPLLAESAPAEADTPPPDGVMAVVNGTPILRSQMAPVLMESHGLNLLEEMILSTSLKQKASQLGLTITRKDILAAHEDALLRMRTPIIGDPDPTLAPDSAEQLLQEFLIAKNLSRKEWDRRMEQRAYLRAISAVEVAKSPVSEEDLKKEFELAYGERVQVRHIQLSSMAAVDRTLAALRQNKVFELVARQLSENGITSANGGLIPPFTRHDPAVMPLFQRTAFELKEGQVSSAFHEGNWYQIIRLERRFPASEVGYENVDHDKLEARLIDRRIRQRQETLEEELFDAAVVDVQEPALAKQFRAKHRRNDR